MQPTVRRSGGTYHTALSAVLTSMARTTDAGSSAGRMRKGYGNPVSPSFMACSAKRHGFLCVCVLRFDRVGLVACSSTVSWRSVKTCLAPRPRVSRDGEKLGSRISNCFLAPNCIVRTNCFKPTYIEEMSIRYDIVFSTESQDLRPSTTNKQAREASDGFLDRLTFD